MNYFLRYLAVGAVLVLFIYRHRADCRGFARIGVFAFAIVIEGLLRIFSNISK